MKKLQNYKMKPEGRNPEVLAKAVELGYDPDYNENCLKYNYIYVNDSGFIGWGFTEKTFNSKTGHEQITVNDFLRLDWTPTVGEKVKCVESKDKQAINIGDVYRITRTDQKFLSVDITAFNYYDINRFIPIYPKDHATSGVLKQEKPDAYIVDQFKQDKDYFLVVHRTDDGKETESEVHFNHLCKFNLLYEADYKAKYEKLMFKNWEVRHTNESINIGCEGATKESVNAFMNFCYVCENHGVDIKDLFEFLNNNKSKLNL